jgi:hypothetical protein
MVRLFATLVITAIAITSQLSGNDFENIISLDFRVFGVGHDDFKELYFHNGKSFEPLNFKRTSRSEKTYSYRGPPTFGIYVKNPSYTQGNENEKPYNEVATRRLEGEFPTGLIVLAANPNNRDVATHERSYKVFISDDSRDAFTRNSVIFINVTGVHLYGKVGETNLNLPVGNSAPISYSKYANKDKGIPITFAFKSKNGPRLVLSNDIRLAANRRVVLILEPPRRKNSTRVEIRMLSEAIYPASDETKK